MNETEEQLAAILDIRQMMKRSSRFLSLSGLSGVFAGVYALAGALYAYVFITKHVYNVCRQDPGNCVMKSMGILGLDAFIVLSLSLFTSFILSYRKAKRTGHKIFDQVALKLLINLMIPLFAGGVFCLALLYHGHLWLVAPSMLIFYGLALVNGSKYTLDDIRYLGLIEIALGLICCFYVDYGIVFWAIGFGIMHIIYGLMMWFKYERN